MPSWYKIDQDQPRYREENSQTVRKSEAERERESIQIHSPIYQEWQVVYRLEDWDIPQCPGGPAACRCGDKRIPGKPWLDEWTVRKENVCVWVCVKICDFTYWQWGTPSNLLHTSCGHTHTDRHTCFCRFWRHGIHGLEACPNHKCNWCLPSKKS